MRADRLVLACSLACSALARSCVRNEPTSMPNLVTGAGGVDWVGVVAEPPAVVVAVGLGLGFLASALAVESERAANTESCCALSSESLTACAAAALVAAAAFTFA